MYVKKKYAHLEADIAEHLKMLKASNTQLGMMLLHALAERDVALAQVNILKEVLRDGRTGN